jgi:hypothetical protein
MRRPLTLCRAALPVAAAALLLTACGGSGNDKAASSSSKASSSASETSADEAGSDFCVKAAGIEDTVGSTLNDLSDPTTIPDALHKAADEIKAITPPDEIAADWAALAGGVEQVATAFGNVNFSDPNALATFEQQVSQLEGQLNGASTNVEKYLAEHCGLGTASPSS